MRFKRIIQLGSAAIVFAGAVTLPRTAEASEGGGTGGTGCYSGGVGSHDCSVTIAGVSCSVSCNAGYYACCGWQGCSCVSG
jgi:hypothetical protein